MIVEPLAGAAIESYMTDAVRRQLAAVEVFERLDSTNAWLLAAAERLPGGTVCLADTQSAGRGRRGRHWVSPPGGNLYLSLLWRFACGPERLSGLSIAAGVATARALRALGADGIGLKWPNDVCWGERKLGGILLESVTDADCAVVTGIGLNVAMPPEAAACIDQPWTDLRTLLGREPSRNRLAAALLDELIPAYDGFMAGDRAELVSAWAAFDLLAGRHTELHQGERRIRGIARGIDPNGALRLETNQGVAVFTSGEASLRPPA